MEKEILPYFMSYGSYGKKDIEFDEDSRKRDWEYFRQLYPGEIKLYLKIISEEVNYTGGRESFIFHEYPDKIRLELLAERILDKIPMQNRVPREGQRQIVKILLYEEIYRRRNNL